MPAKKSLSICLVTNDFPGLTETFVTTKALELNRRGHKITLIKNLDTGTINTTHLALVKQAGIEIITYNRLATKAEIIKALLFQPFITLRSLSTSLTAFKKKFRNQLQQKLLASSFDIVHFEFSGLAVVYGDTIDKIYSKVVVSCRGTAEKVKTVSDPSRKEQLKKVFTKVHAIHCVSQDMADTIIPYVNEPQKIFVNRPSIDPDVFKRVKPYSPSGEALQLLTIGRFTFQKGYLIGLMAMHKLKNEGIVFSWKIVGDGPLEEEMLYHIHALQLSDCVELLGKKNRHEILELYNNADVFLLPSVYEGIANVCLEAMSMQLPVLSTKSGGMEEVIVHRQNGLLCEVYDVDSVVENIKWITNNSHLLQELAVQARKTILKNFTLRRQADVFESEYFKLMNT